MKLVGADVDFHELMIVKLVGVNVDFHELII